MLGIPPTAARPRKRLRPLPLVIACTGAAIAVVAGGLYWQQARAAAANAALGCTAQCCANNPAKTCTAYYFTADYRAVMDKIRADAPDLVGAAAGMTVADIGAGYGGVAFATAARVGPSGKVYATELDPRLLKRLQKDVAAQSLTNVEARQAKAARDTALDDLPPASLDAAYMINSVALDHTADRTADLAYLRAFRRLLRPGGRVLYHTDWVDDALLGRDELIALFVQAGFSPDVRDVPWPPQVPHQTCMCPGQYGMHGDERPESTPVVVRRGYLLVFHVAP